jgi:Tol biopolymer transport system component
MTSLRIAFATGLVFVASGCQAPGVAREEFPEDPIAFIFHPEDEARRRAEAYATRPTTAARSGINIPTVVHMNSFRDYLEEAFGSRAEYDFAGRLSLLNPRSRRVTVLESAQKGAIPLAWSPDRDRLLFAQRDLGKLQLFEFERDSRVVSQVTGGPDHHPQGCYGPDGWLIAVVAKRASLTENRSDSTEDQSGSTENRSARGSLVSRIAVMGPSDALESISVGPMDGEPACSPDGTAVAYVRLFSNARSEIWVYSFADEEPARAIAQGREPAFSPDGEWIVYSRAVGKERALWRIRRDGTGRTRLGRGSGADEYGPAVSPDGSLVVYESVLKNRYRLFVRRFDGTGDSVLFSDGDGTHAVW